MSKANAGALQVHLDFARHLADLAGVAILPHFRIPGVVTNKAEGGGYDPVTAADRAAEEVIRAAIAKRFPEHGIVGEEYGVAAGSGPHSWVIDPIDGTRAFITGGPQWGTLIGLLEAGKPVVGVMDQPFTQERFWGAGGEAHMSVRDDAVTRLGTRACSSLADAVLSTTHPDLFAEPHEMAAFRQVKEAVRMSRFGGDCYAYCMLAAGFLDIVVEAGLKPYDVVALVPIIEGAGGRITTWDGNPAGDGGRIVATGDPRVHEEALAILSKAA